MSDDDYTQVFGVGSEVSGPSLLAGFTAVGVYLLIFGGALDKLEVITLGTSYHLVLQRIYREIMMVGFGSFAFTILNQTNTTIPLGFGPAFGFADICCFAMSSFFCLQGVFIMLLSVKQAKNWTVASQVPAEELLHNISVWELSHPLAWRARFLPFCPAQDQVEFRIFKSIFATAYNIKASHREFDFSIFLRMSHENNIVKIIDITYKNWIYIVLVTVLHEAILYFHHTSCLDEECVREEDVIIFILLGFLAYFFSLVAWVWGRRLELKLIASAGVEHVDDYSIFLMTEFRTEETLTDVATSPDSARHIIANYLKEKETSEVETKEARYLRRHSMIRRTTENKRNSRGHNDIHRINSIRNSKRQAEEKSARASDQCRCMGPECMCHSSTRSTSPAGGDEVRKFSCLEAKGAEDINKEHVEVQGREYLDSAEARAGREAGGETNRSVEENKSVVSDLYTVRSASEFEAASQDKLAKKTKRSFSASSVHPEVFLEGNKAETRSLSSGSAGQSEAVGKSPNLLAMSSDGSDESQMQQSSRDNSMIVTRSRHRLLRLVSGEHRGAVLAKKLQGVSMTKGSLSRQVSNGWRSGMDTLFRRKSSRRGELSAEQRERRFADIIRANFGKQNFKNIFLFEKPVLFYMWISFAMTCNSLYLAWWATNYMFVIFAMTGDLKRLCYTLMTLLPAVIAFPPLFLAIRSSTIVQAITLLDLAVVAKVIEQSQVNTTMLADFRKTVLTFMKKDGPGVDGMVKCCDAFAKKDSSVLTKSELRKMLMSNKVIYSPDKIDFLFGSLDQAGTSTIDYGDFETFLFAENNYESDRKRQELFQNMSIYRVKKMTAGSKDMEHNAAYRILKGLNYDTFREKKFISEEMSS